MPFGLANAPTTFQHLMKMILNGIEWNSVLVYLNDVIVYARTFNDHLRNIDWMLPRIVLYGLKLKLSKDKTF